MLFMLKGGLSLMTPGLVPFSFSGNIPVLCRHCHHWQGSKTGLKKMEKLKKLYLLLKKREKVKLVINENTFKERLLHWKFRTLILSDQQPFSIPTCSYSTKVSVWLANFLLKLRKSPLSWRDWNFWKLKENWRWKWMKWSKGTREASSLAKKK